MSLSPAEPTTLSLVARRLSGDTPFGSHEYISVSVAGVYMQLLTVLAGECRGAGRLLDALGGSSSVQQQLVLRDSLLRRTIEDGIGTVVHGVDSIGRAELDGLLDSAAKATLTDQGTLLGELAATVPFARRPSAQGSVWLSGPPENSAAERFEGQVLKRLPQFRFHTPTEDQVRTLVEANRLASLIAPEVAHSAISHACVVIVGEFQGAEHLFNALTLPGLAGVIVLSPDAFKDGIDMAETLVHESTHLKFLDIDYIQPLFAPGFRPETSPLVTPAWHESDSVSGGWPYDRVLTSMHVYLTLAVFFGNARLHVHEDAYTVDYAHARAAQCRTRGAWLFEAAQPHRELLTLAGRQFLVGIGEMLAALES
ncbi:MULTISPECIES: aKG-HExxH-type peptide beta-hydroxylase [unclassified Knoellia]|uniref:aKG-HExxH-type peptide beta-hydroxylase n=1 Tax=Knoellia altitudinis TaxID=3404795 RepID=UPI00361B844B